MTTLYDEVSALIEKRTGLSVSTRFRADFHAILNDLAGENLRDFLHALRRSKIHAPEWQAVVRALTIGETYFFRDANAFRLLRSQVLGPLIRQRRESHQLEINLWCAGCATGEEPYSVAIVLREMLPDLLQWRINLVGTDLNEAALQQAEAGIFREWAFRHCAPDVQSLYFDPVPGGWQLKADLRAMVQFQQVNLLDQPPMTQCDVILCRNVLIYHTHEHVAALENGLHNALRPGGWLLLGPSEAVHTHRERWITHVFSGTIFYQKPLHPQRKPITRRYTSANGSEPGETAQRTAELYRAAVTAVHTDHPGDAERLLAELLGNHPGHVQAHTLLAYIFANRQALPEAHAHVDAALLSDPMCSDAHYLRAALYLEAGRRNDAEKSLRAALYCRRDHPLATFLIGTLYARAGDTQRANRVWKAARTLVNAMPPDAPVSDLSDMTAATFSTLIQVQIDSLEA